MHENNDNFTNIELGDLTLSFYSLKTTQFEENWSVFSHFHSFYEMHYIHSGKALISIENLSYTVESGSVFLIKPQVSHSSSNTQNVTHYALSFGLSQNNQFSAYNFSEYEYYTQLMSALPPFILIKNTSSFLSLLLEFVNINKSAPQYNHKTKAYLCSLFIKIIEQIQSENIVYKIKNSSLERTADNDLDRERRLVIENYLFKHYMDEMYLENFAKILNVSAQQANRIIFKLSGMTFNKLRTKQRINISLEMIEKTNKSLEEIAQNCGYKSYSGFYLAFKNYFGITPETAKKNSALKI